MCGWCLRVCVEKSLRCYVLRPGWRVVNKTHQSVFCHIDGQGRDPFWSSIRFSFSFPFVNLLYYSVSLSLFYDSLYRETMAFADESVVCWTVTDSAAAAKRGSLPTIKQYNSVLQSLSLHRDRQHKRRHDELGRKTKKIRKKAKGKRTYGPAATIAWDWWGFFGGSYGYLPPSLS